MRNYKIWRDSVIRILFNQYLINDINKVVEDIYKPYFDDGYSPGEAIKEDLGNDAIKYFNRRTH